MIIYRQLLGDISKSEVKELNRAIGSRQGVSFTKSYKEPATVNVWNWKQLYALTATGAGIAGYAKFVKGYNMLWFVGGFVPVLSYALYNYGRQDPQLLENAYRYLLTKRAATVELERN